MAGRPDPPYTGGCECRAVRYRISAPPLVTAACHCGQCQRQSGSAFGMSLVVPADAFALVSGEPRRYRTFADSGAAKDCVFCGDCGVRIYNALSSMPTTVNVKPGTLDDTSWLEPQLHTWLASRQPWTPLPESGARFDGNPRRVPRA